MAAYRGGRHRKLDIGSIQRLIARYRDGLSSLKLAAEFGIGATSVVRYLAEAGVWGTVKKLDYDVDTSGCHNWCGYCFPNGYGHCSRDGETYAHRWYYKTFVGSIPDGYDVHHKCRNRRCVNTGHMELKTRKEHQALENPIIMENNAKMRCIHGHPFDEANTYYWRGTRKCRECNKINLRELRAKKRAA